MEGDALIARNRDTIRRRHKLEQVATILLTVPLDDIPESADIGTLRRIPVFVFSAAFQVGDGDVLCAFDEVAEGVWGEELEALWVDAGEEAVQERDETWGDGTVCQGADVVLHVL